MRTRAVQLIAAAAVALALVLAAPALAQQSPTLGAPSPDETPATTQATTAAGGGGLEAWQQALIFAAGLILIGGIAFAILGDARDRARELRGPETDPAAAPHRHRQRSKQRARAKGRAARAQRRRNR